jgi:hypothetical protein
VGGLEPPLVFGAGIMHGASATRCGKVVTQPRPSESHRGLACASASDKRTIPVAGPAQILAGRLISPRHGRACPGHPRLAGQAPKKDVDAPDTSAFTRVFDALCAGMTTERLTQFERKSL